MDSPSTPEATPPLMIDFSDIPLIKIDFCGSPIPSPEPIDLQVDDLGFSVFWI